MCVASVAMYKLFIGLLRGVIDPKTLHHRTILGFNMVVDRFVQMWLLCIGGSRFSWASGLNGKHRSKSATRLEGQP